MVKFHYFLSLILFLFFFNSSGQVIINEVSSSSTTFPDEDGDYSDWIELYNPSGSPVNLFNYKLSDSLGWPQRWTFPNISIPANGYLTVFASGKDRATISTVDHWEALVLEDHIWKYTVPSSNISGWTASGFNDASWSSGPGGIGYADGDDGTTVPDPTTSVFMRRSFNVVDSAAIKSLRFYMDCDDGFVAYLNGIEIARNNINGNPPDFDDLAIADNEAVMYDGNDPAEYIIAPAVFLPVLVNGTNVLAIQVHNKSTTSSDLSARPFLLAGINNASINYSTAPSWFTVPPTEPSYLHTNFSIKSGGGETVTLADASNTIINTVFVPGLVAGNTYGRYPNGGGSWSIIAPATPNASNSAATSYSGYLNATVSMSLPPGFYSGTQTVSCTCSDPTAQIRYTTDGTKPTASSSLYTGSLSVSSTRALRAICYKAGYISKNVETNTYFINDPGISVPVLSISTKPSYFFSSDSGIYVMGPGADAASPHYGANFWMDWEREVHIEYFKNGIHQFEQDCGIKIFGGWSRANAMKSMRLVPDEKYGESKINYPLFSEKPNISEFSGVHLRNGGNDFNYTHLRDQTNHRVLQSKENILGNKTHIDFSAYEPVAVFINGSYWGIHHMRERYNKGYMEGNHGVSDFEMLEMDGDVIRENNSHFLNMTSFIQNNDMSNSANYNTVKGWLDIENFVDYFIAETYHTNWDWPNNNVKYWRALPDGKWRYLYYDTDFSFSMFNFISASSNELSNVINSTGGNNRSGLPNPHGPMLKKLLDNAEFKNYFVNRYADLMNTIYQPSNYKAVLNDIKSELSPEMSRHFTRWPQNSGGTAGWNSNCDAVKSYMDSRLPYARNHVESTFSLADQVDVTLNVNPAGAGVIKISTIYPDTYPWTGVYFNGVPVTLKAIPNPGYEFDDWSSSSISLGSPANSTITLNIGSDNTFTANFTSTTNIPFVTISEINYNPDVNFHAGNWVELYNYGNGAIDISGWKLKDGNDYNEFVIPNGTILGAGEYLVLVEDIAAFTSLHPSVSNYVGSFDFSLGNSGENLRLYDQLGRLYLSMTYDDDQPWPQFADGKGSTLELVDPTQSLDDGSNWFDGCRGGSPGTAYIPCPCADVNLGPDQILCVTGGSYTINTGLTAHPDRNFTWYYNGVKLSGLNTPTLTASAAGDYYVMVDSMGCLQNDRITLTSNLTFSLGSDVTLCDPVTTTLSAGLTGSGISYVWRKNGTVISEETGPDLTVSTAGTYRLDITAGSCPAQNDQVVVSTNTATPVDASRCGTGSVTLGVTGSGTFEWYTSPTGGSAIATGTSYVTPSLSSTTTYYVKDASYVGGTVGPLSPSSVSSTIWPNNKYEVEEKGKLIFDVLQPLTLNAVTVFTEGAQTVTVRVLQPDKSTVRFSKTVAVSSGGEHRIPLNFVFGAADVKDDYYMDLVGSTGDFEMNGGGADYPYTATGWLSITGTDPSWAAGSGWYFFAYNWEYSNKPGPCERVPVTATINPALGSAGVITGNFNICSGSVQTYTVSPTTGATSYTWVVPSGTTITSGQGTTSITVDVGTVSGNISVTPSNSCGSGTASNQMLTITDSGLSPSVSIAITSGNNPSCFGSSVTFTAIHSNGGSTPSYQWNKNGAALPGETFSAYTTTTLAETDEITCTMTSSLTCASPLTVTSSAITMTVNPTVIPSVSIAITSGSNPVCAGNPVTFTATPVNGGASPVYQWRRNGTTISGATSVSFTTSALTNGDIITCRMTSNEVCPSPATVTSSGITMSVTPAVTPSVSIAISSGTNPTCSGNAVSFIATPVNGGTPSYQWRINGSAVSGETSASFTPASLTDADIVTCSMTSSATCASPATVTSSGITMTVNPVVAPSVNIALTSGSNPTCTGSSVTFTATPTGGGTTPSYQWNRNGTPVAGQTTTAYTSTSLSDGDVITCSMTSNATCANPVTVTSTGISMTVNSSITPSVSIAITSGSNPTCSGNVVAFTATPTGGGTTPVYEWKKNGTTISGETSSVYTTSALVNGDVIACSMTSDNACASPSTLSSAGIAMTVNSVVTPSVSIVITSGANPTCSGSSVTFTATPVNGGGAPAFQWNKNGTPMPGETSSTYTSNALSNSDVITCSMTSNAVCVSPATTTSAGITMTVNSVVTPSVGIAITSGSNPTCSGSSVTFTATPTNGGGTPSYQWNKNGTPIPGAVASAYSTNSLSDSDIITCTMTSNEVCPSPVSITSSGITMSVTPSVVPSVSIALTTGSNPSCSGSSITFTATPINGGGTPIYQWRRNGTAIIGETAEVFTTNAMAHGDVITCTMTSASSCASPGSITSTGITMSVTPSVAPSVSISLTSGSNPGCSGSAVTFTASPTNGGGAPTYQWMNNGSPLLGETGSTFTSSTLVDGDVITCSMTSNAQCASPITQISTGITMSVMSTVSPSASIALSSGSNPTCSGASVSFEVTPVNGGLTPVYQWNLNGSPLTGETNAIYNTSSLANGDLISCTMTSSLACANPVSVTSPDITMVVNATVSSSVTVDIQSGSNPSCSGSPVTFEAIPINEGSSPLYQWNLNGNPIVDETGVSYSTNALSDGDIVTCSLISSLGCANPSSVTSSGITMNITPSVSPTINISITSGSNPLCSGSSITFSANPTNEGTSPGYQWNKNGSPITGATGQSYSSNSLSDGDIISCELTSSAACASPVSITSSGITLDVNNVLTPSVVIGLTSGSNPSCAGSSLTFTATPSNGGVNPSYQWNVNGTPQSGAISATYTATSMADGDVVTCTMTSAETCASPATATSTGITILRTTTVTPSVSIAITTGSNSVCTGSPVTFTATPLNGGSTPSYQWNSNGSPVAGENSATYSSSSLSNGEVITCTITSNETCANPVSVTSSGITMTVNSIVTPSIGIAITSGSNPSCSGASVTFAAASSNGGGSPAYQWKINGNPIGGETSSVFTASSLVNNDVVSCLMTSNAGCANPVTVNSTGITMAVSDVLTPSVLVSISSGSNPSCMGSSVTFDASPVNGGSAPSYQWNINGIVQGGETSSGFTTSGLSDDDVVTCTMTSSESCVSPASATSSGITMAVTNPVTPSVSIAITTASSSICEGTTVEFTASPVNGGAAPVYQWIKNSTVLSGETNDTYSSSTLSDGDIISCTMTSVETCVSSAVASSTDITMSVDQMPTNANAGTDQNITINTTNLAANTPTVGFGSWTQISGGGFIGDFNDPATSVGGLPEGTNIYRWTISNGVCPDSYDEVSVTVGTPQPFVINGPDDVDPGNTYTFFVPNEPGASYVWIVPPGATIVSGNGTPTVTVTFAPGVGGTIYVSKTGGSTGNASTSKDILVVTGINDPVAADSYTIFPNPFMKEASLIINSDVKAKIQLTITDTKGVTYLLNNAFYTNEKIDLGEKLPSGVYVVQALYADRLVTFRIVKTE